MLGADLAGGLTDVALPWLERRSGAQLVELLRNPEELGAVHFGWPALTRLAELLDDPAASAAVAAGDVRRREHSGR